MIALLLLASAPYSQCTTIRAAADREVCVWNRDDKFTLEVADPNRNDLLENLPLPVQSDERVDVKQVFISEVPGGGWLAFVPISSERGLRALVYQAESAGKLRLAWSPPACAKCQSQTLQTSRKKDATDLELLYITTDATDGSKTTRFKLSGGAAVTQQERPRTFSVREIHEKITARFRTRMVLPGHTPASMSVANDGRSIAYTEFDDDMRSHLSTVTEKEPTPVEIKLTGRFASDPVLLGGSKQGNDKSTPPDTVFARLGSARRAGGGDVAMGVYQRGLQSGAWKPVLLGAYADLAVDSSENFLVMTKTTNERDAIRELWVQPLKSKAISGKPYRIAADVSGVLTSPSFSRDGTRVYFQVSQRGLYVTDNSAGAKANLLDATLDDVSAAGDVLLVVKKGDIYTFDPATKRATIFAECMRGVDCRMPKMSPAGGAIYFVAWAMVGADSPALAAILANGL